MRASSSSPRACSGDIYATVPIVAPGLVKSSSAEAVGICEATPLDPAGTTFARPKSRILAMPTFGHKDDLLA